ncbi:MAG: ATP/GTP-binding protein [Candidatus Heimdallarchaeota archaeon]|nr:MAG: ATP/GTP-binding protein [Candidatus Heimdallarchaeota archaeon]
MPNMCYLVGTAGSGKTILTSSLQTYLITKGASLTTVNLDPAVKHIPYQADVDIRDYIDYDQLIDEHNLGPNGAMIAAVDLVADHINDLRDDIEELGESSSLVLVDTPGQMELFAYRRSGTEITSSFPLDTSFIAFLFDSTLVSHIGGFLSVSLLATSVQLRLNLPIAHVITKIDLLKPHQVEDVLAWRENPYDAIEEDLIGMTREFSLQVGQIIEGLGQIPLIPVSALSGEGLELLSAQISRVFEAGEDWSI